jgi:outer membrane protein assembly factor BamB
MSIEQCDIYYSSARTYVKGEAYDGTAADPIPSEPGQFFLRAIDIQTGDIRWEVPMTIKDTMECWPGTLATAGGLVFYADNEGYFCAVDARTGRQLWHFNMGQRVVASPIAYSVGGKQYVAIATASQIFSFGLFEPVPPLPENLKERYEGPQGK